VAGTCEYSDEPSGSFLGVVCGHFPITFSTKVLWDYAGYSVECFVTSLQTLQLAFLVSAAEPYDDGDVHGVRLRL
jgi:hypothetical protein